jgi:hypothetical protein
LNLQELNCKIFTVIFVHSIIGVIILPELITDVLIVEALNVDVFITDVFEVPVLILVPLITPTALLGFVLFIPTIPEVVNVKIKYFRQIHY